MNLKPIAEVMKNMAEQLRRAADELDRTNNTMMERQDITYAGEAMQVIKNCFFNLRLDLLITRPIREFERKIRNLEKEDFDKNG